jgi:biopolymer transport protein ExbD
MAFGRLERSPAPEPMSDINMTPLIDVMLVLLVIFMVAAPLMSASLKLDLPQTEAAQPGNALQFLALAIDARGQLYVGDDPLPPGTFIARLNAAAKANPQMEVQLRADRNVPYGRVAELLGWVQQAGLSRVGFVTETPAPPAAH